MEYEKGTDQSAALQAACTKGKCIELLALAEDYREVLPQVLELLRQYYAADQVRFLACGKEGEAHTLQEPETVMTEAGNYAVSVIFNEKMYGKLLLEYGGRKKPDLLLLQEMGHVLAAEMRKQKIQEYLRRLSYLDQLTGIRNNTSYISMLQKLLDHPGPLGVAFADLNGLKYLNDTYGHEYGDQALRHLAGVCREYFTEEQLFRISGDEFVVLCPDVKEETFRKQAERLKIRLKHEEGELASFGYLWDCGNTRADKLLHQAERLMYEEKRLHYQDGERRVQECPDYAAKLIRQCGHTIEKEPI